MVIAAWKNECAKKRKEGKVREDFHGKGHKHEREGEE